MVKMFLPNIECPIKLFSIPSVHQLKTFHYNWQSLHLIQVTVSLYVAIVCITLTLQVNIQMQAPLVFN